MRTVALYCRVSTDEQATQGTIDAQKEFLRKYADLYGLDVYDTYCDDGISGTVPLDKRPGGIRLLTDAEHKRFSQVIVYRVDRLARSLKALVLAHDTLDAHGIAITSATEPFNTKDAFGKFLFQLLGSMAELEKSLIKERMTLGRDRILKKGHTWLTGTIPTGYDVVDGLLVPSSHIVPAFGVEEIWQGE